MSHQRLSLKTRALINCLESQGLLRPIDATFAQFFADGLVLNNDSASSIPGADSEPDAVVLLVAYLSQQLGQQHSCIDIDELNQPFVPEWEFPDSKQLMSLLESDSRIGNAEASNKLVILDDGRLYLARYWQYETNLVNAIVGMLQTEIPIDYTRVAALIKQVFPEQTTSTDWQKVSVALACLKPFTIITGGPGTGKTTTVAKLMWVLNEISGDKPLSIKMVAPTGKAAARLTESVVASKARLPNSVNEFEVGECTTIHRLLGVKRNSPYFLHNKNNPLNLDLLIVDEASMIDLPMLSKLFEAIPTQARVVMLGDKDQLASVEVGSVLGDICAIKGADVGFSAELNERVSQLCSEALPVCSWQAKDIREHIVTLQKSYRFRSDGGIGQLATAVNNGEVNGTFECLNSADNRDVDWSKEPSHNNFLSLIETHFQTYFQSIKIGNVDDAFAGLKKLQILCMQRKGMWGIETINELLERWFREQNWIPSDTDFYPGKPLMVLENQPQLGLFNGDVGVVLPDPQRPELLKVWFASGSKDYQHFLPGQLPKHETLYAMTTHKSQGSEFEHVILCMGTGLSEQQKRMLNRELLYTGITRAKQHFSLMANQSAIEMALNQRCERASGLSKRLLKVE